MAPCKMTEERVRESLASALKTFGYSSATPQSATTDPVYAAFSRVQLTEALEHESASSLLPETRSMLERLLSECTAAEKKL